jgi:DNA invertase Pin-like site-specific DNA recombinase
LYRNFRDWVTIDEIRGLEVHFVKEATVISEESRSSEKFIHGIKVLMAKNFIDNLSEETRKGMVEKASQGIWPSYAPIGYLNAEVRMANARSSQTRRWRRWFAACMSSAQPGSIPSRNSLRLRRPNA